MTEWAYHIYNSIVSYTKKTFLNPVKKQITNENIKDTVIRLNTIKTHINERNEYLREQTNKYFLLAKDSYQKDDVKTAVYNMKLKKLYENERLKWENIKFSIESHIFTIESMNTIIQTVDILKNSSNYIKNHIDISKVENAMDDFQDQKDIVLDINNLLFEQKDITSIDETDLLDELKQFKKKTPKENKVDFSTLPTPPKSTPKLNPSTKKLNYILKK